MVTGPNRYALRAPDDLGLPASGSYVDSLEAPLRPLRIGWNAWSPWSTNYEIEVDYQVNWVFEEALSAAVEMGHTVEYVEPSPAPDYFASFRAVWMASAASLPVPDEALDALEPLTAWLVRTGRTRPAADLPRALAALKRFEAQTIADYQPYDLILTPLLAMTPRPIGWFDASDGEHNFMQQCQFTPFTSYVNVAGLPALSMPVGTGQSDGAPGGITLPVGVQAIGRPGDESTLLKLALQLEEVADWSSRVPLPI
jgi:amidase